MISFGLFEAFVEIQGDTAELAASGVDFIQTSYDDSGGETLYRIYECLDVMDASTVEKLAAKTRDFSENACCFEAVIPLSLQRSVEGLLQEHIDRMQLESGNDASTTVEDSYEAEPVKRTGNPYPLVDGSLMEKVLQKRSLQMRFMQRA
ncbi:hypothetical protein Tco_1360999 [Tanacetum coccineum]